MQQEQLLNILVVDHDHDNVQTVTNTLQGLDVKIIHAQSAIEALSLLLRYEFAVITLNVDMPDMSSDEAAKLISDKTKNRKIPIIFFANNEVPDGSIFKAYTSGALDYMILPIHPEILRSKICFFLEMYQVRDELEKQIIGRATSEAQVVNILESIKDGIISVDSDLKVKYANATATNMMSLQDENIVGSPIEEHLHLFNGLKKLKLTDLTKRCINDKVMLQIQRETILENIIGERYLISGNISPVIEADETVSGVVFIIHDIANEIRLQRAQEKVEKIKSFSKLLSGVAIEIRSPLGAIVQGGQNIARRLDTSLPANMKLAEELGTDIETIKEYIQKRKIDDFIDGIRSAGGQATGLISSLLQLTEETNAVKSLSNIIAIVDDALHLAEKEHDLTNQIRFSEIKVVKEYQDNMPKIYCCPTEMAQVIYNVLKNAAHALTTIKHEPKITIKIHHDNNNIFITVTDNGKGMSGYELEHIFDPLFTTKNAGEGMGLGMTVAYSIVEHNHDGAITVESETDKGTTVTISLNLCIA